MFKPVQRTADPWAPVRGRRAVMLTTYRRDGRAVATPVGYGIDGSTLYFMTDPGTGKVKRLRHTPIVDVAASTLRGRVSGPAISGVATEVTGAEADRGRRQITATNRLAWFLLLRKARRAGWDWVVYAVRLDQPDGHVETAHVETADGDLAHIEPADIEPAQVHTRSAATQETS